MHSWLELLKVRFLLSFRPVKTMKRYQILGLKEDKEFSLQDFLKSFDLAHRYIPGATCLVQAYAAKKVLADYGQASVVRIGVSKKAGFKAHAWLEYQGTVILGQVMNLADYQALGGGVMKN